MNLQQQNQLCGLGKLTSTPVKGAKSSSGLSYILWLLPPALLVYQHHQTEYQCPLSGMMTSPSFLELSSGMEPSPKDIKATIKKNKPSVIKAANPMPAMYLL
jgi:hypothetical protein